MSWQDTALHDQYKIKYRAWHHDDSNISDGRPVARLWDRSLPHSCEGSHQLVTWIDLFSLNILFSDRVMPEFTFCLPINYAYIYTWMHANARASSQRKGLERGRKRRVRLERDPYPTAHVLCAKTSIRPALRILQNRFWEKVRLFCSLRGLLTKYSDLFEI